jgi:hypothetical protein
MYSTENRYPQFVIGALRQKPSPGAPPFRLGRSSCRSGYTPGDLPTALGLKISLFLDVWCLFGWSVLIIVYKLRACKGRATRLAQLRGTTRSRVLL